MKCKDLNLTPCFYCYNFNLNACYIVMHNEYLQHYTRTDEQIITIFHNLIKNEINYKYEGARIIYYLAALKLNNKEKLVEKLEKMLLLK